MQNLKYAFSLLLAFAYSNVNLVAQASWSNGVGEIFYSHCSRCHHDGGIGPFPIMSYDDISASAADILAVIQSGEMPPWPANPDFRHFAFENVVDDAEMAVLQEWIAAGAPEGDPNNAPELPQVDFTGETGEYASTATNADAYRTFVIPSNFTQNQFIDGIEIIPGNPEVVHHVLIYYDPTDDCLAYDAADPGLGFETNGTGGGLPPQVKYLGAWVPGNSEMILPEGFAFLTEQGGYFLIEIHYPEDTEGLIDNTTVNFKFSESTSPREVYMDPIINHFPPILEQPFLFIPANDTATFYASYNVPTDITLIATMPHMHLIGREMYCWAETPTNTEIPLVGIDEWDFHWQYSYMYPSLVKVPDNSELRAFAYYDNTANNPHQPNDPPQNVLGGEETDDEMLVVFFVYTPYQSGDENIVIDPTIGIHEIQTNELSVTVYPNPTSAYVNLQAFSKSHGEMLFQLYNMLGEEVLIKRTVVHAGMNQIALDLKGLEPGVYLLSTTKDKQRATTKIMVE
jgi:mono/diheme cytochrome c family protein